MCVLLYSLNKIFKKFSLWISKTVKIDRNNPYEKCSLEEFH